MNDKSLAAKVLGSNLVNEHAKTLVPLLQEWLRPFLGQSIFKSTGGLLKKVTDKRPEYVPAVKNFQWYLVPDRYTISVHIKAWFPDSEHSVEYYEGVFYIANIENGYTLKDFCANDLHALRTDMKPEEIEIAQALIKRLEDRIRDIKRPYIYFIR